MNTVRAAAIAAAVLTIAVLAGCTTSENMGNDTADPGTPASTNAAESGGEDSAESSATMATATDLMGEGMPTLPLAPCGELVDSETNVTTGNTLWSYSLSCTTRDAFDKTSADMLASGWEQQQEISLGSEENVSDRNFFAGDADGGYLEVTLIVTGSPGDFDVEYIAILTVP